MLLQSERSWDIPMKPTHFFSGLSKSPVLLHKCLKSKGYMEFSTVSSSCSFLHMRSSGDSAPSDQGREHQMDIHVLVHVFDAFFKGEIPRCESVGQRVLHIVKSFGIILLKLPPGNLATVCLPKSYIQLLALFHLLPAD